MAAWDSEKAPARTRAFYHRRPPVQSSGISWWVEGPFRAARVVAVIGEDRHGSNNSSSARQARQAHEQLGPQDKSGRERPTAALGVSWFHQKWARAEKSDPQISQISADLSGRQSVKICKICGSLLLSGELVKGPHSCTGGFSISAGRAGSIRLRARGTGVA
jgi:hypothetical protein